MDSPGMGSKKWRQQEYLWDGLVSLVDPECEVSVGTPGDQMRKQSITTMV